MIGAAVSAFLGSTPYELEAGPSGMNNMTRRIRAGDHRYVLRIYNSHNDPAKAAFEHEVLRRLAQRGLGFRVPQPLPAPSGETAVCLPEYGKLAALFAYIEGRRPDLLVPAEAEAFGAAAAELTTAMKEIGSGEWGGGLEPQYPPYYELGSAHPRCSLEEVARLCSDPPEGLHPYREDLRFLSGEIVRIRLELAALKKLPHQLIHGDLNATNALAHPDGSVAALLDFEFATMDLRAMEPAVCLWGLVPGACSAMEEEASEAQRDVWDSLRAFWRGFGSGPELLPEERAALPVLMQLRSLDVFIHFLGRFMDGVDAPAVLQGQIPDTAARMRWVAMNREKLRSLLDGVR